MTGKRKLRSTSKPLQEKETPEPIAVSAKQRKKGKANAKDSRNSLKIPGDEATAVPFCSTLKDPKEEPKKSDTAKLDEMNNAPRVVMQLPTLIRATVVHRPSKVIKSPYMADILVEGSDQQQICHSPALGCSGLIIPGTVALVTPKTSSAAKSKYSLDIVDIGNTLVGVNPNFCNKMVKTALENGWVSKLPKFNPKEIKSEFTLDESRFDFKCEQDGVVYYIEVKGVPNASDTDPPKKKKQNTMEDEKDASKGLIAYFPDGHRKAVNDPISPRALKHVEHLSRLTGQPKTVCAMVFVIQRPDCHIFQPTKGDPIYRRAVYEAHDAGVLILPHVVSWKDNTATWGSCMQMNLKDETDDF